MMLRRLSCTTYLMLAVLPKIKTITASSTVSPSYSMLSTTICTLQYSFSSPCCLSFTLYSFYFICVLCAVSIQHYMIGISLRNAFISCRAMTSTEALLYILAQKLNYLIYFVYVVVYMEFVDSYLC